MAAQLPDLIVRGAGMAHANGMYVSLGSNVFLEKILWKHQDDDRWSILYDPAAGRTRYNQTSSIRYDSNEATWTIEYCNGSLRRIIYSVQYPVCIFTPPETGWVDVTRLSEAGPPPTVRSSYQPLPVVFDLREGGRETRIELAGRLCDMLTSAAASTAPAPLVGTQAPEPATLDRDSLPPIGVPTESRLDEGLDAARMQRGMALVHDRVARIAGAWPATTITNPVPPRIPNMQDETTDVYKLQCKICLDNHIKISLLPCGHAALCHRCAVTLDASTAVPLCPACRNPISTFAPCFII